MKLPQGENCWKPHILLYKAEFDGSITHRKQQIKSNQTNYFIVRLKVDQRAGQLSLPHLGIA